MDGNFDAVMSLCACVIGLEENYNKYKQEVQDFSQDNRMNFLVNNSKLFAKSANINPQKANDF